VTQCSDINDKNIAAAKERAEQYKDKAGNLNETRKGLGKYVQGVPNSSELFDKMT
jgi:hypothetical protein